ncbi:MAG TPA: thioredoxin-disulfide reductase [Candidatus Hydrogenedentes bacterium]|nr:thioredoxin-disulfide reductase [Candidatus Hydrogenedentota bacterium]HPC17854.1 thioredoxin-disulfide reductase [Candidatus Hydrogenedentota bacterium]HRT21279.1 thioredoxin-disulfide reductase [Candidatus Hydrogenedentota bacterium]HRT65520.1 thioredoxin-disulfide reductase [Candidatus Hydrogenedentota bacterium]
MENVVVIGGGPAGCTAALYAARADLNPLVLEGELSKEILPGGQLMTTTEVENFPGFPDGVSGPELCDLMKRQAIKFGARFVSKTAASVDLGSRPFTIQSGNESWQAKAIIIATGATARYMGLESEDRFMNRGVSACATCDGALPRFRNKPVVVVGGGDSAMEEALFLARFASRVHVVHRRDKFRASKIMGDRVIAHEKITVEWNSVVDEVLGNDKDGVTGVRLRDVRTGETRELACTGYFSAIGHKPNTDLFAGILDRDETGYLITKPGSACTNIPGVFAAGDVQDHVYRQAITAAGSGCMAAIDCVRWLEAQET